MADDVVLIAPLTGVVVPIEDVPDPVFAKKMVGDGFSILPMSTTLCSPAAGEVAHIHDSQHAITVRTTEGLEVLMHIGLDTVGLGGDGFETLVAMGDHVDAGTELVRFDPAVISTKAASSLTQVVIANGDMITAVHPATGFVTAGKDIAARIDLAAPAQQSGAAGAGTAGAGVAAAGVDGAAAGAGEEVVSETIVIPNPTGLHARPAATLTQLASEFSSDIQLRAGDQSASAKSILAIMGMGLARGTQITLAARGADAEAAIERLTREIRSGLGEDVEQGSTDTGTIPTTAMLEPAQTSTEAPRSEDPHMLLGVAASPGLGLGQVVQWRTEVADFDETATDADAERSALRSAVGNAQNELAALRDSLDDPDKVAIFAAHSEILDDPSLADGAEQGIAAGKSAPFAWQTAYTTLADQLSRVADPVLAGRATDIRDVGGRVLRILTGGGDQVRELPASAILVAEDLTPSDTATLDPDRVVGFATVAGGASSHVAIIARSMGIPAVAGIERRALDVAEGTLAVLDGAAGSMRTDLTEDEMGGIRERQARLAAKREEDIARAFDPVVTTDGHTVEVVANIGNVEDAQRAVELGADGVGLLRSEFVFMSRATAPSEDEQAQVYADVARALKPGQPLVIRTLDVGGDKPLPYLPMPAEENPFLGVRGVRIGLQMPEILRVQCRAILKAADAGAKLQVMFPMIATLEEFRAAKAIFDEEAAALGVSGVPLGIMVEVPSVAVMAPQFAREADFFSVGSNDLTSYTLAMDRGHPTLAPQVDACNPSVLRLIGMAADAAHAEGKWLGVCGGVASDPQAVPFLLGLGVDEFSCSIPAIPGVKAVIRSTSMDTARDLARRALEAGTPAEVRALNPVDEA